MTNLKYRDIIYISSKGLNLNRVKEGDVMAYDYSKLNGRIVEVCGTQAIFAEKMGLSERTISLKVNNKIAWKQPEMQKAAEILHFPESEIQAYFFTMKVQLR